MQRIELHEPPTLRTARLVLEAISVAHAIEMSHGLSDAAAYRYLPEEPPEGLAETQASYRRLAAGAPDADVLWCNWIIRRTVDQRCLGYVQATIAGQGGDRCGLIGYLVFPDFWRLGYGSEAVAGLLGCLFVTYDCLLAEARVDTRNTASLALLAGLGFGVDALLPDADHFKGAVSDEYLLSLGYSRWATGMP